MSASDRLSLPFDTNQIVFPSSGNLLIIRATPLPAYDLFDRKRTICVQTFKPTFDALQSSGFSVQTAMPKSASMALVHLTRSRDENRAHIAQAYSVLDDKGLLIVDGIKTDGIESLLKHTKQLHPIDAHLSKSHGKIFWLTKSGASNPFAQWLDAVVPNQNKSGFYTAAGMFSPEAVDAGSAELAPLIEAKLKGRGADFGAGWGWLAFAALASNPEIKELSLIEAEHSALECARQNIKDLRALFRWEDATQFSAKAQFDFVIMNPPFHQTRRAEPDLGQRFIRAAAQMLHPKGQLYLVANRQLAYEHTLDDCFQGWSLIGQTPRYKMIAARKPKK